MQERTIYEAFNGATFSDQETCLRYERLAKKWQQASEQLAKPKQDELDSARMKKIKQGKYSAEDSMDYKNWLDFSYLEESCPEVFLGKMALLQELAAFMASED